MDGSFTPEQSALVGAIARALEADPRVLAAWLAGSLGRGAGDAFSDVDVLVLVRDGGRDETSSSWAADMSPIADTVLTRALFGGAVITCVTDDWMRFDLSFVEPAGLKRYDPAHLKPLFDKGAEAEFGKVPPGYSRPRRRSPRSSRSSGGSSAFCPWSSAARTT